MNDSNSPLPQLPGHDAASVPVFNCHVILSPPDDRGDRVGRVANLAGIEARGATEREILLAITRQFKAVMQQHALSGTPPPWLEPPQSIQQGESERYVPVHL